MRSQQHAHLHWGRSGDGYDVTWYPATYIQESIAHFSFVAVAVDNSEMEALNNIISFSFAVFLTIFSSTAAPFYLLLIRYFDFCKLDQPKICQKIGICVAQGENRKNHLKKVLLTHNIRTCFISVRVKTNGKN